MTQEALKLALEALEYWDVHGKLHQPTEEAITAIKEALAQEQEQNFCSRCGKRTKDIHTCTPPQRTEQEPVGDEWTPCMKLPVVVYVRKQRLGESHVSTREGITPVKPDDLIMRGVSGEEYPIGRAIFERTYSLNTTPPQRTWIGLTEQERNDIEDYCEMMIGKPAFDAIEAKLKQKNGYAEEENT